MRRQRVDACVQGLQRALRFCGRRSLLEEYIEVLLEIARLHVQEAPLVKLIDAILPYVDAAGMHELRLQLIAARTQAEAADLRELQPATPLD